VSWAAVQEQTKNWSIPMARRRATGFLRDFQEFIKQGNVVDLAVAVVIGGAFGNVVNAVVELVTTALLNPVMQTLNIQQLEQWPAGKVLVALINFLIIAFVVFLIVKAISKFRREEAAEADPAILVQEKLADAANRLTDALDSRRL
jgi:large conductance mechanosensitive channel